MEGERMSLSYLRSTHLLTQTITFFFLVRVDIKTWPISEDLKPSLAAISETYDINPLQIFKEVEPDVTYTPVSPPDVNSALHSALVKITFQIIHHRLKDFDSFVLWTEEIIIIKPSAPTLGTWLGPPYEDQLSSHFIVLRGLFTARPR